MAVKRNGQGRQRDALQALRAVRRTPGRVRAGRPSTAARMTPRHAG